MPSLFAPSPLASKRVTALLAETAGCELDTQMSRMAGSEVEPFLLAVTSTRAWKVNDGELLVLPLFSAAYSLLNMLLKSVGLNVVDQAVPLTTGVLLLESYKSTGVACLLQIL